MSSIRSYVDSYDRDHESRLGALAALLVVSALAGLLVAGMLLPVVGGAGLAVKGSSDSFENLPGELKISTPAQRSRIVAANGTTIANLFYENRTDVPITSVPLVMRHAMVAIEDSRFYSHNGVDVRGTARALASNLRGGSGTQGGSTITQQYVKQVLLESATSAAERNAATVRTTSGGGIARKLREARYALALEQRLSKDEILQRYLNIVYFGSGAYGINSAAARFFSVPVTRLTLPQSALIAGLVRSPTSYNPIDRPAAAKARRDTVLARMAQLHYITPSQQAAATRAPLGLKPSTPKNGCDRSPYPFFCDFVISELKSDPALGATQQERTNRLLRGGLTIRTTIDAKMQRAAQKAVESYVPRSEQEGAAENLVEPGTGRIKAMAMNRAYGDGKHQTKLNYSVGGSSGFQAGSTFKIFTLAAALKQQLPLSLTINSPATYASSVYRGNGGGPYIVSNAGDSEAGNFDMEQATWASVNTYFVQLEERTGIDAPARIAESMGLRRIDPKKGPQPLYRVPSFTLGTNEVSPLAMAGAYAAFAAHGSYCPPTAIRSVVDSTGHVWDNGAPTCKQVLSPAVADTVTSVLQGVISGPHAKTGGNAAIGRPAAGKTGTVQAYAGAWFCGYTPQLAGAVWMGDPRGGYRYPLQNVRVNGSYWPRIYGGDIPARIWAKSMEGALRNAPVKYFAGPDEQVVHGKQVQVPYLRGMSPDNALAALRNRGLVGRVAYGEVSAGGTPGTVGYSSPGSGNYIGVSSTVLLYITDGTVYVAPPTTRPTPSPSTGKPHKPGKPKPVKTKKPTAPAGVPSPLATP